MMDLQRLTKSVEQLQNFLAFLDCSLPHELCLGSIPDIWCHIRSTLLYTTLTLLRKINLVGNTSSSSIQVDIQIFIKFSSHVVNVVNERRFMETQRNTRYYSWESQFHLPWIVVLCSFIFLCIIMILPQNSLELNLARARPEHSSSSAQAALELLQSSSTLFTLKIRQFAPIWSSSSTMAQVTIK